MHSDYLKFGYMSVWAMEHNYNQFNMSKMNKQRTGYAGFWAMYMIASSSDGTVAAASILHTLHYSFTKNTIDNCVLGLASVNGDIS